MTGNPNPHSYLKPLIRVLHVEDSATDVVLIKGMLQGIRSHKFELKHVPSMAKAIVEAQKSEHDVILLDLTLEDSTDLATVERMREASPLSPIVVTTSNESQLLAQNAIRKGAQDYLFKGHINKDILNRTICNAIDRKIVDNENNEKKLIMATIMESAVIGYWDWHIKDNYKYLSPTLISMLGYSNDEIDTNPATLQKYMYPDDKQRESIIYKKHISTNGKSLYEIELRYYHKNGSIVWVSNRGKVVEWDKDGSPLRMIGYHIDITTLCSRIG